jgi:hypothetical protein
VRSFNFIRIAALSLFGMGAVLATGSVASAQSSRGYNWDHSQTEVSRHREDRNFDRDRDRGRQTNWYPVNNYNRYDRDRDGRRDRDDQYQQRSGGFGIVLHQILNGRRH